MKYGQKTTISEKAAMVEKRLGAKTGENSGRKPAPPVKVKPTGNPLKGKIGVKITKKF